MTCSPIKKYLAIFYIIPILLGGIFLPVLVLAQTGMAVTVSPNQTSYQIGTPIQIKGQNFPAGATLDITIGNKPAVTVDGSKGFLLNTVIDQAHGFSENGTTQITFEAADKNDYIIDLQPNYFKVTVGSASSQVSPSATPGQTTDCAVANPDPNKCLKNPLGTNNLTDTLIAIMRGFLIIIGVWAVAFIVIGGFRMVMSQGQEEAYLAAKKTITWAVIGFVVALLSFSIIAIVQNLIGANIPATPTSFIISSHKTV